MQRLLRQLYLGLFLTVALPASGQVPVAGPENAADRVGPLNLSLPRGEFVPAVWSERVGAEEAVSGNQNAGEGSRPETRQPVQRSGRNADSGLPYGTGFEARQRSGTNDRGMGRGMGSGRGR
jgi:hypothetical protein